tara:strand:- start:175 stop:618 length:444 start_codon:yes stop_codon:yes gene_type:complete
MAIHKIDGVDGDNNFPKKLVTLYASGACTAGKFVAITTDTTNGLGASVADAAVGAGSTESNGLTFGVATETVAAGSLVTIQTAGKYENASVASSTAAGDSLTGPLGGATAGMADRLAETTFGAVVAVALEAESSNLADVMIVDQGFF